MNPPQSFSSSLRSLVKAAICSSVKGTGTRDRIFSHNSENLYWRLEACGSVRDLKVEMLIVRSLITPFTSCAEVLASPASMRKQFEPLQGSLKQAVQNRLIERNIASNVRLPKVEGKEIAFLASNEAQALISILPESTGGRALRFIMGSGLRASELCGLRWSDISDDSFQIRQAAQFAKVDGKQQLVLAPPKTKAGRRTIPLTPGLIDLLDRQRTAQIKERLVAGPLWIGEIPGAGNTLVFATEVGSYADRANLDRTLRRLLKQAGLPSRGLHALRHTFATSWIRSNSDPRTLSEVLGHTKVAFTIQQYVHTDMAAKHAGMMSIEQGLKQAK